MTKIFIFLTLLMQSVRKSNQLCLQYIHKIWPLLITSPTTVWSKIPSYLKLHDLYPYTFSPVFPLFPIQFIRCSSHRDPLETKGKAWHLCRSFEWLSMLLSTKQKNLVDHDWQGLAWYWTFPPLICHSCFIYFTLLDFQDDPNKVPSIRWLKEDSISS